MTPSFASASAIAPLASSTSATVPVVPTAARQGEGIPQLLQTIGEVATGELVCKSHRIQNEPAALKHALSALAEKIEAAFPGLPNARWVALRLLEGDQRIIEAVRSGELGNLNQTKAPQTVEETRGPLEVKP